MATTRLSRILRALSPDGTAIDFAEFDANVSKLKTALKEKIQAKTLEDVNAQLESFKRRIDFTPLTDSLLAIEKSVNEKIKEVNSLVAKQAVETSGALRAGTGNTTVLTASLAELRGELKNLQTQAAEIAVLRQRLDALPDAPRLITDAVASINAAMAAGEQEDDQEREQMVTEYTDLIEGLRKELTNRINNMPHGGNANRDIKIGGANALSKFTDINLKAGTNVTISYSANQATKYTDVTLSATGGAGTSRSISTVSVSSVVADTASTDIVILANAGVQLTMPTAAGNTNLYTIKNTGTSSVLVNTTGGETIDAATTLVMPTQFTSVDMISDGTNWQIT